MVDHLTRITVTAPGERAHEIGRALAARGFTVRAEGARLVADSTTVEARDAKAYLRALGVADREYRLFLEYVRKWGIL